MARRLPATVKSGPGLIAPGHFVTWRGWPVVLVLLGALLRLHHIGTFALWYDEAASLYLGQNFQTLGALFDPAFTSEPPLNTLLVGLWSRFVDLLGLSVTSATHDAVLRLLPWCLSVATLPVVYRLARRLTGDEKTARFALLLFAINPLQIAYAQELRIYSALVLLALLAVDCMVRALEENRARHWAGFTACIALMMYAHFISMWYILALNVAFVLLMLLGHHRDRFWPWTAANGAAMVLIAPMLYRAFAMHAEVQTLAYAWYPHPDARTALITFKSFFAGFGPSAWAYRGLVLIAGGLVLAAFVREKDRPRFRCIAGALLVVPVTGCALHWGMSHFSFYEHRLFIVSGAAALLLAASGAATSGRMGNLALGLLVVLTLPMLADYQAGRLHPMKVHRLAMWDKVDFRGVARFLEENGRPGDRLVYASHFSAYPMGHYYGGDQIRIGWSHEDEVQFIQTMGHEAILRGHGLMPVPREQAVAGATRVWFLATHGVTFEWQPTTERIRGWLAEVGRLEATETFRGATLWCYRLDPPAAP